MKKIILVFSLFCYTFFFSQKSQHYIQVSYGSICCGTLPPDPVIDYISQFQKKNKTAAFEIYRQSGLGREGEFNLYIGTDQLSRTKKDLFIRGLQSAVTLQNSKRNKSSDGHVNFDESIIITKADLANSKNLTIYKK